jgi:hypothetical protein
MRIQFDNILRQSPVYDDNLLILAYGEIAPDPMHSDAVFEWMEKSDWRRLVVLVGALGDEDVIVHEAEYGEVPDEPERRLKYVDVVTISAGVMALLDQLEMPATAKRVWVVVCPQLHLNLLALSRAKDDVAIDALLGSGAWDITEALTGSSNLTLAAAQTNIELDMHLERSDRALLDALTQCARTVLSDAKAASALDDECEGASASIQWDIEAAMAMRFGDSERERQERDSRDFDIDRDDDDT